ncbi:GNAT family N-acetyltransferase [Sphingomonas bacterium]|uniref:GNAT family N-acetyltransferase n=1 Tax=Sphingomonas bacterium TaxID=1895847 RepID=UPI00260716AA|nr:GNAT family N-acetyltransferase [Sphingomonas bacterium]MDB5677738.1 N-acetyltransferase [Sphingomonas bacterium]
MAKVAPIVLSLDNVRDVPVIRDAASNDAVGILPMYNYAVRETTAIFDTGESDLAAREIWLTKRQEAGFPVLVAEIDGAIAGFASFGDFRAWDGYRFTVEHSIYVAPDRHREGIGRALLTGLIERARAAGKHAMVAGVEAGNAGSIALHVALGFREVGRMPQVAEKFGRWLDLVFLQLLLDDRASP